MQRKPNEGLQGSSVWERVANIMGDIRRKLEFFPWISPLPPTPKEYILKEGKGTEIF